MPHEALYWLLSMSLLGTVCGLLVWLFGRWRRLPRRIAHGLWIVPLLRLWLPFGIPSGFSLLNLLPDGLTTSVPLQAYQPLVMTNCVQAAASYTPVVYRDAALDRVFSLSCAIWLTGLALLLCLLLVSAAQGWRAARSATLLRGDIYVSRSVAAPVVCGILRPRILIPPALRRRDLTFILAHERAHIRRLDNLWRIVAILTACLHWFNPCVWLMLRAFLRDAEAACDESVITRLDEAGRSAYAHALVDAAEIRQALASPFGGGSLRSRIAHIVTFRRLTLTSSLGFLALSAALAWALVTNAA